MKTGIFTVLLTATILTLTPLSSVFADPQVIAIDETRTIKPDGKLIIERTVLVQEDDKNTIPLNTLSATDSNPVLVYDGIEEPLFIETSDDITVDRDGIHETRHFE